MAGVVRRQGSGAGPRRRGDAVGTLGLLALLLAAAALGFVLRELGGGPRAPDGAHIRKVLSGTELADADLAAAAAAIAWLVLAYLALSVGLRLALLLAGRLSGGARWARTGLRLSNLVTIPAVRRLVDGGVGGTLLAASWLPLPSHVEGGAGPAYAAAAPPPPLVAWVDAPAPAAEAAPGAPSPRCMLYTVAPGDDLWEVARRCYGDGSRFVEIFEASRGLPTEGGERFSDPRMIRPGSVLRVPLPALNVEAEDDVTTYRVRRGDHLWGIAERFLGDGFRWVEIWERNSGREVEAGSRLTDPNQIHPGWLLELPVAAAPAPAAPAWTGPSGAPAWEQRPLALLEPPRPAAPAEVPAAPVDPVERPAPGAGSERGGGRPGEWPELPRPLLATAAGFVAIGGTAVFVQRLARSGGLRLPGRGRAAAGGPGDAVRVTLATRSLASALADYGFDEARALLVQESGTVLAVTLSCPAGDVEALAAARHGLERRLDSDVDMGVLDADRVLITLPRFQSLAGLLAEETESHAPALVVPVGADDAGVVYLNLAAGGPVTLAGSEGERRQMLRSWLATLASTHAPQELALRMDAATAGQLGDAAALHGGGAAGAGAAELIPELEELLQSRSAAGGSRPVLAIVSPEPGDGHALDGLLHDGPGAGLFIVRAVPAEDVSGSHDPVGARVLFRAPEGGLGDEEVGDEAGVIALTVGPGRPRYLEAVTVRRDTSARWGAGRGDEEPDPPARSLADGVPGGAPRDQPERTADEPPENHDRDRDIDVQHAPDPELDPREWPWESAVLDSACGRGAAVRRPPPDELAADAYGPGDPGDAEALAPGPGDVDRGERPEGAGAVDPACGRDAAVGHPPTDEAGAPADGPDESAGADAPADAPGEAADDCGAPGDGAAGLAVPPVPHVAAALPAAAGRASPPAAGQATLFSAREMSDLEVEVKTAEPIFQIRCLGPLRILAHGAPVDRWRLEKSRELLAFMAAHGPVSVAREVAAEALWPDGDWDASRKHILSNAVTTLRSTLRAAAPSDNIQPLVAARQRLQLSPSLFTVDLDAFDAAIRRIADLSAPDALDEYEHALRLYAGELLEGEFFTWLDPYRMDYHRRLLDAARAAASLAESMGAPLRAEPFHRAILEREPTDEDAVRGLMRCLARSGDVAGARKTYTTLSGALEQELGDAGVRPSAETRALLTELVGAAARG